MAFYVDGVEYHFAEGEAVEPVLWPDAAAFADIDTVGELAHLSGAGALERRARA